MVAIALIWYASYQREQELSKRLISKNEIELMDLFLTHGSMGWKIFGRVKNTSQKHTLTGLRIKVNIKDCIRPGDCEIVCEDTVNCVDAIVLPGQSRSFRKFVFGFPDPTTLPGKYDWYYSVIEVRGRLYKAVYDGIYAFIYHIVWDLMLYRGRPYEAGD